MRSSSRPAACLPRRGARPWARPSRWWGRWWVCCSIVAHPSFALSTSARLFFCSSRAAVARPCVPLLGIHTFRCPPNPPHPLLIFLFFDPPSSSPDASARAAVHTPHHVCRLWCAHDAPCRVVVVVVPQRVRRARSRQVLVGLPTEAGTTREDGVSATAPPRLCCGHGVAIGFRALA